jgi:hypothetical protein
MIRKITALLLLLSVLSIATVQPVTAQKSTIPLMRQTFHDRIDAAQKSVLRLDGTADNEMNLTDDEDLNLQLTYTATRRVDDLQKSIEADTTLNSNSKIKYLRGLSEIMESFARNYRLQTIKASAFPVLVNTYTQAVQLDRKNASIQNLIAKSSYEVGSTLVQTIAFQDNPGYVQAKSIIFLKECRLHPDRILPGLYRNSDYPFTDSLIVEAAHYNPDQFYDYAQGYGQLARKIQDNPDTLVQTITKLAVQKAGRLYFPFLDNLYRGKITLEEIDSVKDDVPQYYSLLVKTKIDYMDRVMQRDTPMGLVAIDAGLAEKGKYFINTINGLHESPDNVRFKILDGLTPQELYYLAVLQEELIYTSSYVRGVYPRIFKRMKNPRGDSLLIDVRFDHFKKWIKMAANYNTLDDFLKRMEKQNAVVLMKAFVNGLDKTLGKDSLEDAVDVAGSYASIYDKNLQQLILHQVQENLQMAKQNNNKRAHDIYSILNTLFLSMDSSNHIDVSKELGIRPVYFMPNKSLEDTTGRIIVQQFFYGDKDGKNIFSAFVNAYSNSNWKKTSTEYWLAFTSTRGKPITIYSNRPLDEEQGLDEKAQQELNDYLAEHDINPTVVLHRGHSYYLNTTLKQLPSSAQVVLLGSCGGYQSLSSVLSICPEAQIVSSKQTGSGLINLPLINGIIDKLRLGKDLDWPAMWATFRKQFNSGQTKELFDDYVPPYKNLGATFIMAYTKMQDKENG